MTPKARHLKIKPKKREEKEKKEFVSYLNRIYTSLTFTNSLSMIK